MRKKHPYIALLDQVRITRRGDTAIIEYADGDVATTHFQIGSRLASMTDAEILECWNEFLEAQAQLAAKFPRVVVEVPPGKPQIKYHKDARQWVPRGDVLRCVIEDDANGDPVIYIDDQELSWRDFGRLVVTHAGWGMRVMFVPEERVHERPRVVVREPKKRGDW